MESYNFESIRELKNPLISSISSIKKEIDKGSYDLIIGDDSSGRIPTIIIRKIINDIYTVNGHPSIKTIFISGTLSILINSEKNTKEKIRKLIPEQTKRAIIVTEYISGGGHVNHLAMMLNSLGIKFDVLSLYSRTNPEILKCYFPSLRKSDIIIGNFIYGPPAIYAVKGIAGTSSSVREQFPISIFSVALWRISKRDCTKNNFQETVNMARSDSFKIADETKDDIWK